MELLPNQPQAPKKAKEKMSRTVDKAAQRIRDTIEKLLRTSVGLTFEEKELDIIKAAARFVNNGAAILGKDILYEQSPVTINIVTGKRQRNPLFQLREKKVGATRDTIYSGREWPELELEGDEKQKIK